MAKDYPFDVCAKDADKLIAKGYTVLQKFTCSGCGNRLTMPTPNVFYRSGTCDKCEALTIIEKCNYLVTTISPEQIKSLMED